VAQALLELRTDHQQEGCMGRDYRKLDVFRLADEVVTDVYTATSRFPSEETFGMVRQIRRAAISVPCNIVEGCARRGTGEYLNFISIAAGSANETRYLLDVSCRLQMLDENRRDRLCNHYSELIAKLQALIRSLEPAPNRQ
jgi:four helix bundle protein